MKFVSADNVPPERVDWIWNDRIPRGMLSIVAGRPNQGKGLFVAHMAALVSRDGGNVLYSAAEDSRALMTRPRLEAAGADLSRVFLTRFQLPRHFEEVAQTVREHDIELIVMDPFAAHLSGGISRHSDNVREVLNPLCDLLEETATACIIVEHVLKRVSVRSDPLNAIGGTGSGLPAASRVAYIFGSNPDDDDQRILAPAKFNLGAKPKCFAFETDIVDVEGAGEMPFLLEDGEVSAFNSMRLFETYDPDAEAHRPPEKRAAAAEWLTAYLLDAGGAVLASTIYEDAKQAGMSAKTLKRAATQMDIVKHPSTGPKVTWDLPMQMRQMLIGEDDASEGSDNSGALDDELTEDSAIAAESAAAALGLEAASPISDDGPDFVAGGIDEFLKNVLAPEAAPQNIDANETEADDA